MALKVPPALFEVGSDLYRLVFVQREHGSALRYALGWTLVEGLQPSC
jgi:hypothetical protein